MGNIHTLILTNMNYIIAISILSVLLLVCIYIIINLLSKNNKLIELVSNQYDFIESFRKTIIDVNNQLQKIDSKHIFESDDDIGFFFEAVKNLQSMLNQYNNVE